LDIREDFYLFIYYQGGEALAQVAQRGGGCPVPCRYSRSGWMML